VPANIAAVGWTPGYDVSASSDAGAGALPALPRFECRAANGTSRTVRFEALPAERPDHLKLSEPLVAGEHCTITSGIDCAADDQPKYLNGYAEFDVIDAQPVPELGLIAVTSSTIGAVNVAANASCSEPIRSCTVNTSLEWTQANAPWRDVMMFETIVDGEPFSIWHDQITANELGGLYRGRERDVVFAPLGDIPENVHDFRQLELGEHTLAIRARLPGSDVIMETPSVTIELDCGPKAGPALAENVIEGDSGGCTVASPLRSSQRRMGVVVLFGMLLLAARRRRH
jgi:MYXO-CTERM domain-containing protein